jgi:cell division protein FtsI/penicillin-binding protein 2
MVAERRFGPLIAVLFAVLGVFLARLFQVQVLEHEVWAAEAASLVRSSQLLPAHRGRILDREGRVLVEDEDVWRVDFVYRDFRRGHPLGIVAHARSTLEMRAVPLAEALSNLETWARELVEIPRADLDRFESGRELKTATLSLPATGDPKGDLRRARASDLRYYAEALLHVTREERVQMRTGARDGSQPFVEDVARARRATADGLRASLAADLGKVREQLGDLARLVPPRADEARASALDAAALVARMEAARERFEDAAADALFERAAGFSAGRLSTAALVRTFDLGWIARILRWDPARLRAWEESRRPEFLKDLDEIDVPRIAVRAGLEAEDREVDALLDGIAALYAPDEARTPWRDLGTPAVLAGIQDLFDLRRRPEWSAKTSPSLPLLERDFKEAAGTIEDPWLLLGTLAQLAGARLDSPAAASAHEWAAAWKAIASRDDHLEGAEAHAALRAILLALDARFTAACDGAFEACLAAGAADGRAAGPLPLSRDGVQRAELEERFLLKDISSRTTRIALDASYALVHLLERNTERYRGFEVGPATRRKILARDPEGTPVARTLIGGVRGPTLREVLAESRARSGEGDEEGAAEAAARILRADEKSGTSGVEALLDRELRGRNGWFEATGLDEERPDGSVKAAVDGKDVVLTLDLDLQLAAQDALAHPHVPAEATTDPVWLSNPVGAIVLLDVDGSVLAAASEPTKDGLPPPPGRDLERSHLRERTLTLPVFNPPGSTFKPFVAAYAIDRLGLDPSETFVCGPLDDGGVGYEDRHAAMHCHPPGHGRPALAEALAVSCNATFAQIGERFRPEQLIEMADLFGFGRPTGIKSLPGEDNPSRKGLLEQTWTTRRPDLVKDLRREWTRMRFANGLSVVEATPMQVARAMAGLVTGRLPDVRLARKVGDEAVGTRSSELAISTRAREMVLKDLAGVVDDPGGTAHGKGLDRASLGFAFACKTGSADTKEIAGAAGQVKDGQRKMRKQTWIAGWFPVEKPRAVLVVLLHDVSETSVHTSVYVAAQFLRSPAVKKFLEGGSE